jgi:predicted flap endonuclease-1-like 5' DNA nuclease
MIYLITQLAGFLLLALASAALIGWVYAAQRAAPARARQRTEREALVRDLRALATGDGPVVIGADPELVSLRSRVAIESARANEAERHLEAARAQAEEATGRAAELQRALEAHAPRAAEIVPDDAVEVEATPVPAGDETALQAWRLRYFERRVRYLEGAGAQADVAPEPEPLAAVGVTPIEWRARVAEARATHLEDELRDAERAARSTPPPVESPPEVSAFAADPETDALLRWRMLYLERRVAHLQGEAARLAEAVAEPEPAPALTGPDPELWKWRARYLEARLRYLEARTPPAIEAAADLAPQAPLDEPTTDEALAPEPAAPPPLVPAGAEERPPTLPGARGGAPDDLTLIDGVSPMQQTTLYSLGVFHFDQVAAWTAANVAWVDQYLRLRGRIVEEEWVEQADDLARDGVLAARRVLEDEDA